MIYVLYFLQDVFMSVRQLIVKCTVALLLSFAVTVVFATEPAPKKESGPDFAAMIRELQLEVKKIKNEILKMHADLQERQERAERRRALQKQEGQNLQDQEYKNERQL